MASDGLIDTPERGLGVAGDHERELRFELEKVLAHEPRRHPVLSGQFLDDRFVPGFPARQFLGDRKAGPLQIGNVGRVTLRLEVQEGFAETRRP